MNQDKLLETTRKAIEAPLQYTRVILKRSKKLRTPSRKAAQIGSAIGLCAGGGLLLTGSVCLATGRPAWAIGSIAGGSSTILSNIITRRRNQK